MQHEHNVSLAAVQRDSRGGAQYRNHVAKDASESKKEDEGSRDEACQ